MSTHRGKRHEHVRMRTSYSRTHTHIRMLVHACTCAVTHLPILPRVEAVNRHDSCGVLISSTQWLMIHQPQVVAEPYNCWAVGLCAAWLPPCCTIDAAWQLQRGRARSHSQEGASVRRGQTELTILGGGGCINHINPRNCCKNASFRSRFNLSRSNMLAFNCPCSLYSLRLQLRVLHQPITATVHSKLHPSNAPGLGRPSRPRGSC